MGELDGRVAIVTGASRGMGKVMAQVLAAEGAKVVCAARTLREGDHPFLEGSLNTTVASIKETGGIALAVQTDVSREEQCARLVETTKKEFGPCDLLVNNAATNWYLPVKDLAIHYAARVVGVMFLGPFMLSHMTLPDMIARRSGAIVNISSGASVGPGRAPYKTSGKGSSIYSSQKAALERFTQALAQEVYQYGISVTCISPSAAVITPGVISRSRFGVMLSPTIKTEPPELTAKAIVLLATEPFDKISGRVTYSQAILKEYGLIDKAEGWGVDKKGTYSEL